MKKVIDVSQALVDFEGRPIPISENDSKPIALKTILLAYCARAGEMGLSDLEQAGTFEAGMMVGAAGGKVELDQSQYDVLKKLADSGKIKTQQGEQDIFGLLIKQQVKQMVNAAETLN